MSENTVIKVTGIYLRNDITEIIDEIFAHRYNVDLTHWIAPYGFYDEAKGSIISNGGIPDGTYVALGVVQYPSSNKQAFHTIGQFNIAKSMGIYLTWANKFLPYPNVPSIIETRFSPKFPLFRIADNTKYLECVKIYQQLTNKWLTIEELIANIDNLEPDSLEDTIYLSLIHI